MSFKFEELKVWQMSLDFSFNINEMVGGFPREELFILTSQIKRASDSISLNIAEGSTGQSNKEFSRFLGIAIRSAIEVVSCLFLARKRGLINDNKFKELYNEAEIIIKMLQALRKSINKNL